MSYTRKELAEIAKIKTVSAIIDHLIRARTEGADRVYFDGLATSDDITTLGDLVDKLNTRTRFRLWFEGGQIVKAEFGEAQTTTNQQEEKK